MSMWGWINSWLYARPDAKQPDRTTQPILAEDDPRLAAAVDEARRRWPEFVAALARRRPGQTFAVKAPIREGSQVEFVWLSDVRLEGEQVSGRLDSDPGELKQCCRGDRLQVSPAEVVDWTFEDDEILHGCFTAYALKANQDGSNGPPLPGGASAKQ
jgi:uncharacterized protein YegJ (DUF2314 family)